MTLVMGIVNVTPDSFSDGGKWATADAAIERGLALAHDGAQIIDVGGESTRPGAQRVEPDEEIARVIPVVTALAAEGLTVSVDTMRARTAQAAVGAGASMVNDVSGGLADPAMARTIAELECDYVAMHWRAHSTHMDAHDTYRDVVTDVYDELHARVEALHDAGVSSERIVIDPGLGFSKVGANNWRLLAHLDVLQRMGPRMLIGASRKRFVGSVIDRPDGPVSAPEDRDFATSAITTMCVERNVWAVRVHNVRAAYDAIRVVSAWQNAHDQQE